VRGFCGIETAEVSQENNYALKAARGLTFWIHLRSFLKSINHGTRRMA
jgi:hypothetical protein